MKRLALVCALALGLASCGPRDFGDSEVEGSIEDRAEFIADIVSYMLPLKQGEFDISEIRAEGRELVLVINTNLDQYADINPFEFTKVLRPVLCEDGYRGFIEAGGVVRIDIKDPNTGRALAPGRVASCQGV